MDILLQWCIFSNKNLLTHSEYEASGASGVTGAMGPPFAQLVISALPTLKFEFKGHVTTPKCDLLHPFCQIQSIKTPDREHVLISNVK